MRKSIQFIGRQAPDGVLRVSTFQPAAAGAAICAYAAWNARGLLAAWLHSPFDRSGSLAFALWVLPIAWLWRKGACGPGMVTPAAFAIGLAVSFAGLATDLNVFEYLGLAIALAGFLPVRPATFLWLACAVSWMPAAGWAFSSHGALPVNCLRAATGLAAAVLTPIFLRHDSIR
jgi:hypothetical protein